jgi:hypothetical protein
MIERKKKSPSFSFLAIISDMPQDEDNLVLTNREIQGEIVFYIDKMINMNLDFLLNTKQYGIRYNKTHHFSATTNGSNTLS